MQYAITVEHVSMKFHLFAERVDNLKEYVVRKLERRLPRKDEFWALRDVSLCVCPGEVCALIGFNGSGKSTLLKVISGILEPTMGRVEVNGRIAPLIELGAGFEAELTGRENVFLNGAVLGYSRKMMRARYEEIIDFSELREFEDVPLKNYSSGMVARLGFSIATSVQPDILIVDEILAVGDFAFQQKCYKRISDMMKNGTTILLVSHSERDVKRLCNHAVWIDHGGVRQDGPCAKVFDAYKSSK